MSTKCQRQLPEVFCKNFAKFTGKHCVTRNLIKKETQAQVFSCEFCKISKTPFLQNTSGRLLLECIFIQIWGENIFNMIHDLLISLHKIQSFPLRISKANLTGFYMMTASVMKELRFYEN